MQLAFMQILVHYIYNS